MESIGLSAVLDDRNFQAGLKRYTAGIGQMTKITDGAASAISGAFKVATGALLIGVGAIGGILATSVKAAADAEQIAAQTDAVLQSTKGVAGMTREAVGDLATALSELTPFEDDAIQGGENLLLTFTNIGKNVFPLATETMLDMSQAMGQDLKSSAIQLGKALNQPAEGLSALQRVGVQFTKAQEDQVKALVAAGKTEEAQRVILKELQTEFGGAAKAAGKTFAGQLQILKNTLGNVQEEIGGALLPVLTKLAGAFVKVLADPKVKAGIKAITGGIEDLVDIIGELVAGRSFNAFARFYLLLDRAFGKATADKIYNILSALGGFKDFILNNIIPAIQRLWGAFQAGGLEGLGGQIARELQRAWPAISAQLKTWGGQFWDWLTGPGGAIAQATGKISEFAGKLGTALQQNWPTISAQFVSWRDGFWDWLTGPQGALSQTAAKISEIAENIIYYLPDVWSKYIQPALMDWVGKFWQWVTGDKGLIATTAETMDKLTKAIENWLTDPATAKALEDIGGGVATTIITGIGNLFSGDQSKSDNAMNKLVTSLNNARINLANGFAGLGANIGADIANALINKFTGGTLTEPLRAALYAWLQAAINALLMGNTQPLIQRIIDWLMGQSVPNPTPTPAPYSPLPSGVSQFANGGWVNRTGMALVHRGEYVIPARQAQNISNNNSRTIMPGAIVFQIQGGSNLTEKQLENVAYRVVARVMEAA